MIEVNLADKILSKAWEYIGSPSQMYKGPDNGLDPETGFDCSGFVKRVLEDVGVEIPEDIRHVREFWDKDFGVHVHWGVHQAGDLVFVLQPLG